MPICRNCDSQDFELLDGFFYCQVCNVQSQDVAEEEADDEYEEGSSRLLMKEIKKKNATKKENVNRGKPWYSAEAFQVILKSQVDALIRLGCSPKLNDIVKQLWFKYIHRSGVAVIDPSIKAVRKPLDACTSFRDRYLSGVLGKDCIKEDVFPNITNKACKKIHLPSHKKSGLKRFRMSEPSSSSDTEDEVPKKRRKSTGSLKADQTNSITDDQPWRSDEEWLLFSNEADSSSSESDNIVDDEKITELKKTMHAKKLRSREAGWRKKIYNLHLMKLVAIINVALQWCREPVTIGDLIEWIKQGYLPYIDCFGVLLPHMKLTDYDIKSIRNISIPSYQKVADMTEKMIKFISLPCVVPEVDVRPLVARYVAELNLPLALSAFIDSFMKVCRFDYRRNRSDGVTMSVYMPECVAVGLVIVSLKLLFGLNDDREWCLDEEATACENHDNCTPFLWKEWSAYHLRRLMEERRNPKNCIDATDPEAIDDIHSFVEHWKNVVLEAYTHCKEKGSGSRSTKKLKENAETKRWAFMKISEMQGSNEEIERRKLLRQRPYVAPTPRKEDNMWRHCLDHVIKKVESNDYDYIWYADDFTRVESCGKKSATSCRFDFFYDKWSRGNVDVYFSYDLVLALAHRITSADKILIHTIVQDLERKFVHPHLVARDVQKYSSTDWTQTRRVSKYIEKK